MNALSMSIDTKGECGSRVMTPETEYETAGRLRIMVNGHLTTEGLDLYTNAIEEGPMVAGYPMAEWFAWNWWRLRWEAPLPHSTKQTSASASWAMSHSLSTIGSGYCWPEITISTDGLLTDVAWRPWSDTTHATFRYLATARSEAIPARTFEGAVDGLIASVIERLDAAKTPRGNLGALWDELREERSDEQLTRFRRMEARAGYDPDEHEEAEIEHLLERAATLGEEAFEELASDPFVRSHDDGRLLRERHLEESAQSLGFEANPRYAARLGEDMIRALWGHEQAWKVGENAAMALRAQEGLPLAPVSGRRLSELGAMSDEALYADDARRGTAAFLLDGTPCGGARVVLRSANAEGRRFEMARLIGDLTFCKEGRLFPATATSSYRQKAQRAFAAELLCPWEAIEPMLDDVSSEEDLIDIADHFGVSPLLVANRVDDHLYRT